MRPTLGLLLTTVAIGIAAGLGVGTVFTAPDAQLHGSVFGGGGGSSSSANYSANITLGQTASGSITGTSRGATLGFWTGANDTPPPTGDADGDGVPDASDNCPNWPNPTGNLPPWPVPAGDPDCDGFTTTNEQQIGTSPNVQCAATVTANDEPPPDRWPPDLNDNRLVNTVDIGFFVPLLNEPAPGPPYDIRYDLTFNGLINTVDIGRILPFLNQSCS